MNIGKKIGVGKSAQVFCWRNNQVIKLFYPNISTAWIEYETQVSRIVYQAGLAVPEVEGITEVDGQKGIVIERIEGDSMLNNIRLKPWKIFHFARLLAELQTEIHRCHVPKLLSLQKQRKLQIRAAQVLPENKQQTILDLLDQLPTGRSLCHGDFHPGNIILSASKSTVIDWSNALQGNSQADVALTLLMLLVGEEPTNLTSFFWLFLRILFCAVYLQRYLKLNQITWKQIQPWLVPEAAAWLSYCSSEQEQKSLLFIIEKLLRD
ncbi:phosphotransferase family protein [Pleurocapsa sp. PCC 7319]|uniref:phosphotransferase family protein n=1 Tax=Pleurocapsa sp. PCC 7319 TaxID=118161 RepID=UPI000346B6C9|nr:aminoglycoside phosphotransferase family protein [Pleurocapsa sp. PCC 7319]